MIIGPMRQRQILNSTACVAYSDHGSVNSESILILTGHRLSLIADCSHCPTIGPDCECCRCIGQALVKGFRFYIAIVHGLNAACVNFHHSPV